MNAWLNAQGYLKVGMKSIIIHSHFVAALMAPLKWYAMNKDVFTKRKLKRYKKKIDVGSVHFDKTRAYRFPIDEQTEGIVINVKGRQPSGSIAGEEYESLRTELITRLLDLQDPRNGKKVVQKCLKREDIYTGDRCMEAPDIIVTLQDGYYAGSKTTKTVFSDIPGSNIRIINGSHRPEGDVAPTVVHTLGEKIPRDVDGKVISSIFSDGRLKNEPEYADYDLARKSKIMDLSSFEEESMKKKLKDLGYL
jgi:predicted AlkP superfamily phosphohydrolase/phosphomutase